MTLQEALENIVLLPTWEDRYTFVLELAKQLPPMPESSKTEATKVQGCTSQVWMTTQWHNGKLVLNLDSDAHLVRGLLGLVWLAFNGKTKADIAATNLPALLEPTGLLSNLSPNRRNGFASVVGRLTSLGE